jgi:outer membrane protein TolC
MIWGSGAFQERRGASCRAWSWRLLRAALLATAGLAAIGGGAGSAETIGGALVKAYLTNPDINSQRAAVRQTDEGVPEANAGYLPKVSVIGNMAVASITGNQIESRARARLLDRRLSARLRRAGH